MGRKLLSSQLQCGFGGKGKEIMSSGIVNSDVLKGVVFNGNGDYAEGGLDVSLGHKSTLPEAKSSRVRCTLQSN